MDYFNSPFCLLLQQLFDDHIGSAMEPVNSELEKLDPVLTFRLKDYLGDTAFPDDFWKTSTPQSEEMDSQKLNRALEYIYTNSCKIHSFLVIRNEKLVFEYYGNDDGRQLTPDDLHDMYSTTKTFTSALIGIAVSEGLIKGAGDRVMDYFKDSVINNLDENKKNMTIEDLLTMRSGLAYSEDLDFSTFYISFDTAQSFLNKPMACAPGSNWNYSTGNVQILAEIIRKATGKTPLEFGTEKIFNPLGITNFQWPSDRSGTQYGGMSLMVRPRDLARFGYFYLKKGQWKGKEVIPASWVEISTKSHSTTYWPQNGTYGYLCWIPNIGGFATRGRMGQNMYIFPDNNLIVVFTAGLPKENADIILDHIVQNFVLNALK
jgi:CubicO group peptidase (beta-lactamase class C family)